MTALTGISIAMPTPAGDGTNGRHVLRCSSSVSTTPITAPTAVEVCIHDKRASDSALAPAPDRSWVTSLAKPTHRCDVGLRSCAPSPTMP